MLAWLTPFWVTATVKLRYRQAESMKSWADVWLNANWTPGNSIGLRNNIWASSSLLFWGLLLVEKEKAPLGGIFLQENMAKEVSG